MAEVLNRAHHGSMLLRDSTGSGRVDGTFYSVPRETVLVSRGDDSGSAVTRLASLAQWPCYYLDTDFPRGLDRMRVGLEHHRHDRDC